MKNWILASLAFATAMTSAPTFAADQIRIMHYNVENLFDVQHDQNKDDWEYLPANYPGRKEACAKRPEPWMVQVCLENDWTEQKLELKLNQIKRVVESSGRQLPDMMSVVEVENDAVVQRLAKKLGFAEYVMTDSPDERGIDVALMFNQKPSMKLVKAEKIRIPPAASPRPTRDLLKVTFKTGSKFLVVYVNHWPSQGAPAMVRNAVAEVLMKSVSEELQRGNSVIATGDFNVVSEDRPDPFYNVVTNQTRPFFLMDVNTALRVNAKAMNIDLSQYPAGTYFFAGGFSWNMLDRFFISPDMLKPGPVSADIRSYQILATPLNASSMTIRKGAQAGSVIMGTPKGFDFKGNTPDNIGFSDHFPILMNLNVQ